jgi:predicted molibdopterin-dependent oxidoreductase YjgC
MIKALRNGYQLLDIDFLEFVGSAYIQDDDPEVIAVVPQHEGKFVGRELLRGISDNDVVTVFNDRGKVRLKAKVSQNIKQGVVALTEVGGRNNILKVTTTN